MPNKEIKSRYGLIGDDLELKENISLLINNNGKILKIRYNNPKNNIEFAKDTQKFLMVPSFINSHIHIVDSFAKELGFRVAVLRASKMGEGMYRRLGFEEFFKFSLFLYRNSENISDKDKT